MQLLLSKWSSIWDFQKSWREHPSKSSLIILNPSESKYDALLERMNNKFKYPETCSASKGKPPFGMRFEIPITVIIPMPFATQIYWLGALSEWQAAEAATTQGSSSRSGEKWNESEAVEMMRILSRWWQLKYLLFSPLLGEMIQFD